MLWKIALCIICGARSQSDYLWVEVYDCGGGRIAWKGAQKTLLNDNLL
jgi:hypothetical protein